MTFRDGAPAAYGFGLARAEFFGRAATCHEGGLRGFRSFRVYLPEARISVITLFNHMADPRGPAVDVLGALLDAPPAAEAPDVAIPSLAGRYLEPESGIAVRIETAADKPGAAPVRGMGSICSRQPRMATTAPPPSASTAPTTACG